MKNIILFFFIPLVSYTQNIQVVDHVNKLGIENAVISNGIKNATTDKNGFFNLKLFTPTDSLNIQHVAYIKKMVSGDIKKIISLKRKITILKEINLNYKTKLYSTIKGAHITIPIDYKKASNTSVSEILKSHPGVSIQESQSGGGSPNFRGMEANRLLLVIDGVSLNNTIFRSGHTQNAATINPFFLKSINLVTGPSSVVFGNGAMGNALIFNTSNPVSIEKPLNHLNQKFESSANSSILNYKVNYSKKNLHFLSGFSIKKSNNLKMGSNRIHGYKNWGKEEIITSNNEQLRTSYWQTDFMHKTLLSLSKTSSILFNTQYSNSSKINRFDKLNDLQNNTNKYTNWYYGPQKRLLQSVTVNNNKKYFFADNLNFLFAFQNLNESRHVQKKDDAYITNRHEDLLIFDINLNVNKKLKKINFNYGAGGKQQFVFSSANRKSADNDFLYATTRYPDNGSVVKDVFIYSQLFIPIKNKTKIYVGSRYNYNLLEANFKKNNTFSFPDQKILTANQSIINSFLLNYNFSPTLTFNTCYYTGFRNPNIDDVGKIFSKGNGYVVIPNNELKPERSENIELGFNAIIFKKIILNVQLFNTTIFNAIARENGSLYEDTMFFYDGDFLRIQMNKNIAGANISGLNFNFKYNLSQNLILNSSLNFLQGINHNNDPLAHIPPFNSSVNLKYLNKKNIVEFYALYNGWKKTEDYDLAGVDNIEEATIDGSPSWYTLNIAYTSKIDTSISYTIEIKNLFDTHYKLFGSGLSASGRNFTLSLHSYF